LWQQAWQAGSQQAFACTGRANHQQIMPTGGGYLQGPPCGFLAFNIGKVWRII
jgi:hypothetical protein